MPTLYVKAAPGLRVPMEDKARRHIGDTPVTVPESAYYLRCIEYGDLIRVSPEAPKAKGAK
ncbi:hypothetical protein L1281_002394 [Neisseria sp. HSC-16F19]|nr:DUF2635 domain-containing protein [Neisseria sp. HSC-16F19]MCP2041778.1 hypothetical protein [Neisseria sp. HSC-16F19]